MKELTVHTGRSYRIKIERGLLKQAGPLIRSVSKAARAAIVTDSNVAPLYAERLRASLEAEGFAVSLFVFDPMSTIFLNSGKWSLTSLLLVSQAIIARFITL